MTDEIKASQFPIGTPVSADYVPFLDDPEGTPILKRSLLSELLGTKKNLAVYGEGGAPATPADGEVVLFARTDGLLYSMDSNGVETLVSGGTGSSSNRICEGRLTPTNGVPVEYTEKTGITSLYFVPYMGTKVKIFDGLKWQMKSLPASIEIKLTDTSQTGNTINGSPLISGLADVSQFVVGTLVSGVGIPVGASVASIGPGLQVTLSANATADGTEVGLTFKDPQNRVFDVFLVVEGIGMGVRKRKWTSGMERSTALGMQDEIETDGTDAKWLYVGTYGTMFTTAGQTQWDKRYRLIWNHYNQQAFPWFTFQPVAYTHASSSFVLQNASENAKIFGVFGKKQNLQVETIEQGESRGGVNYYLQAGIGIDSVTSDSASYALTPKTAGDASVLRVYAMASYEGVLAEGYHYIAGLDRYISDRPIAANPVVRAIGGFLG